MKPIDAAIHVSVVSMLVLSIFIASAYIGLCIVETWGGGL
jgi:hypothetical protein